MKRKIPIRYYIWLCFLTIITVGFVLVYRAAVCLYAEVGISKCGLLTKHPARLIEGSSLKEDRNECIYCGMRWIVDWVSVVH